MCVIFCLSMFIVFNFKTILITICLIPSAGAVLSMFYELIHIGDVVVWQSQLCIWSPQ